ncbi:hypothetical protein J1N35_014411 [Gossypium stocksii]|uniref:CCHC-type domain-containing protein n=1 Tax=Gossypium stocksii TaxID=47602 RepID=A0A9D4A8V1_9ROSI|nr:hypothetical protein J1N35_014411 [Gossypium stocksii]
METTVVVKLLGWNIGYGVLHKRILSLWEPSQSFCLMGIENGYYLIQFKSRVDYDLALTQGPWIVFGLLGFLYKRKILEEIWNLVDQVVKLDFKTESGARGQFARMAVSLDLEKPLTSQVSINGRMERVEFEGLPMVCFACGKYGHLKVSCSSHLAILNVLGREEVSSKMVDKKTALATMADDYGCGK